MKAEKISDAVGELDEDILAEASEKREKALVNTKNRRRPVWISAAALAACIGIIAGTIAIRNIGNGNVPVQPPETAVSVSETTVPTSETTVSTSETTVPTSETTVPTSETTVPTSETTVPTSETTVPTSETTVPTSETTVPTSETTVPTSETTVSTSETTVPTSETTVPTSETTIPTSETTVPTSETTVPTSETTVPTSETEKTTEKPPQTMPVSAKYARALASAQYPDTAPYVDEDDMCTLDWDEYNEMYERWTDDKRKRSRAENRIDGGVYDFYSLTARQFLSGAGSKNRIYSPVNVYMALSMLAETSGGDSREQILGLLGVSDIDVLREQANNVWTANYRDDGSSASILANSVWLNENLPYRSETVTALAENYYASSFSGDPAKLDMTELLQGWLNEQTHGMLEEQVDGVELSPDTSFALCSTVYFNARWHVKFREENNEVRAFHTPDGDVETTFMSSSDVGILAPIYGREDFSAVRRKFGNGGEMWFILPDEDKTVDDVLASDEYMKIISGEDDESTPVDLVIHLPKFDVCSDIDLKDGLEALGVTDIFENVDFSPLLGDGAAVLDRIEHAARVMIDEEGCKAAAYTVSFPVTGDYEPQQFVDLVFDRPFIFVIRENGKQPLFIGVVNDPTA